MIHLLATLAVILLACIPGQAQNTKDQVHLRGTVHKIVPLADFSGTITPVDFDPRFAFTLRIESVNPAVDGFNTGAVVTFAVHYPARLFLGEDPTKGRTYDFSLQREAKHGKTSFFGLKIEKVRTAPAR
jgi:hypothetical protein